MKINHDQRKIICNEVKFKSFLISGPGGQNLQKNATGAEARWDLSESRVDLYLKEAIEQIILFKGLSSLFQARCQTHRSLDLNKKEALKKLLLHLEKLLFVPKKRIATKPTRSSKVKTKEAKQSKSLIKKFRQKVKDY